MTKRSSPSTEATPQVAPGGRFRRTPYTGPDPGEVTVVDGIEYSRRASGPLRLDLYLPTHPSAAPPVVVWLHGGGWRKGNRTVGPDLTRYFACRGYAMASIDYRLSGVAHFPAQIEDVRTAVRWLRANGAEYGLQTDSMALWGSSAGGHLAALAATTARHSGDRVQAVVDGYGPTDFTRADEQALAGGISHAAPDSPESELLGLPLPTAGADLLRATNPIAHITRATPPFLILHGTADKLVPPGQSELLHDALVAAGVESTLYLIEGLGHAFLNGREFERRPCPPVEVRSSLSRAATDNPPPATFELVERFLDRHLRHDPWRPQDTTEERAMPSPEARSASAVADAHRGTAHAAIGREV